MFHEAGVRTRTVYIYYGGGRWQVSVSLPSGIRLDNDDYVTLEMDTDEPYRYHDEVSSPYPPGHPGDRGKGKPHWKK